MISCKMNVIRFDVAIGSFNPFFNDCKEYNETGKNAFKVLEAIEWEFENAGQKKEFEKMRSKGMSFKHNGSNIFLHEYSIEYTTKTSWFE